jgi:hypothetical protein
VLALAAVAPAAAAMIIVPPQRTALGIQSPSLSIISQEEEVAQELLLPPSRSISVTARILRMKERMKDKVMMRAIVLT